MRVAYYLKRWRLPAGNVETINTLQHRFPPAPVTRSVKSVAGHSIIPNANICFTRLASSTWELSCSLKTIKKKAGTLTCHHWLSAVLLLVMNTNSSPVTRKKPLAERVKSRAMHLMTTSSSKCASRGKKKFHCQKRTKCLEQLSPLALKSCCPEDNRYRLQTCQRQAQLPLKTCSTCLL